MKAPATTTAPQPIRAEIVFKTTNQGQLRLTVAREWSGTPKRGSLKKKSDAPRLPPTRRSVMATTVCKLFVGGLNVETTVDGLRSHFEQFGTLSDCVVVMNPQVGRSRCFGFITYSTLEEADAAMAAKPHAVDGKFVELKKAVAREDTNKPDNTANVKKIFVGGVKDHVESDHLVDYFSKFGVVEKAEIISDKQTGRKRGFAFVYFEDSDGASNAVTTKYHDIDGNQVEVKKAMTKQEMSTGGGRGGRGRGRGMPGYGRGGGDGGFRGGYASNYGGRYSYVGGYNDGGGYGGYGGYDDYDQTGGDYNNGDFGEGYGQQHSNYGAMKGGNNYSYRSGAPYNRGGGGYGRGGGGGYGFGGGYQ